MLRVSITEAESALLVAMIGRFVDELNEMSIGEWQGEYGGLPRAYAAPEAAADALQVLGVRLAGGEQVAEEVSVIQAMPTSPLAAELHTSRPLRGVLDGVDLTKPSALGNLDELLARRRAERPPAPPAPPPRPLEDEDDE